MNEMRNSGRRRDSTYYGMNPEVTDEWLPIYRACRKRLKATKGSTAEESIDLLCERDQTFIYVSSLVAEAYNGGLIQWFDNLTGDRVEEAMEALERIGARKAHTVIAKAIALFPGGRLPRDQETREKVIRQFWKEHPQIVDEQLEQLTDEFYETGENVLELVVDYWHRTEPESDADTGSAGSPE